MSPSLKWTTRDNSPIAFNSIGLSEVQKVKKSLPAIIFARAKVVQSRLKLCNRAFQPINWAANEQVGLPFRAFSIFHANLLLSRGGGAWASGTYPGYFFHPAPGGGIG